MEEEVDLNKHLNRVRNRWTAQTLQSSIAKSFKRNAAQIAGLWLSTASRRMGNVEEVVRFLKSIERSKPNVHWRFDCLFVYDMPREYGISVSSVRSTSFFEVMACLGMPKWFSANTSHDSFCELREFKFNDAVPHRELMAACYEVLTSSLVSCVRTDQDATLVKSIARRLFDSDQSANVERRILADREKDSNG